jgi:hypothetical protein
MENLMPESANKPFTHTAWMLKTEGNRKGCRIGRWIEEGVARLGPDGGDIYLHSTPIGGFNGHIHLCKIGTNPPDVPLTPQRPGVDDDHADDEESED